LNDPLDNHPAKSAKPERQVGQDGRTIALRVGAVLLALGISLTIFFLRDQIPALRYLGYPGVFLVALLSNATIILPVPGVMFTSLMGAVANPFLVALAAGTGAALGEITGYLAGIGGRGVLERSEMHDRVVAWVRKYGVWGIMVLSMIPNPFFDIAGMVSGMLKIPLRSFLLACWVGSTVKMLFFALFGTGLMHLFGQ